MTASPLHPGTGRTSLVAVLVLTALGSVSTGVFWNGITFVAKAGYSFSPTRTAALYMAMGVVYALGAWTSGRVTRWCSRAVTVRTLLAIVITAQAGMAIFPLAVTAEWAIWGFAIGVSWLSSLMWPIVESYLGSGRHGSELRRAIGWFNVVWMIMVALPLLGMGPLLEENARWALGGLAPINLLALPVLLAFAPNPRHPDSEGVAGHVGREYPFLLRSIRVLLPASYVLNAALSPVLPYRFEAMGTPLEWQTLITSTWMVVRVVVVIAMWKLGFWHGRWGTLLAGSVLMSLGFGAIVVAPTGAIMLIGFVLFGAGMGIIYYAALYYAMAVGKSDVDAGGMHEALIGAGYTVGPIAVLTGHRLALATSLAVPWAIVGVVGVLVAGTGAAAIRPYREARRLRSRTEASRI